jgi:indoleamine 2,3-dioxygenase
MPAAPAALQDLKAFEIDEARGFLPAVDPWTELPRDYAVWDELGAELPRLLLTGRLRPILESLPALDAAGLSDEAAVRRAMLLLSFLGHAYVWNGEPQARIPSGLALPWCQVAQRLGRPPVLSYASYALDNWRLYDPQGPVELGNLALLQNFLGGADEDWFIGIHIDIEFKAASILRSIGPLLDATQAGQRAQVEAGLATIAAALQKIVEILRRMPEFCDPYVYYHRVRPWIHGWQNQPALPRGVVYEGVEALRGRGQKLRGETGAQSGIVPVLDALLGVEHADDPLRGYLMEMRSYMPPRHRAFVEAVEQRSDLRRHVKAHATSSPELVELHDECLHWLEGFRSLHADYAAVYIARQSQVHRGNPNLVGTGGTPFMPYLKKHRDETAGSRLGSVPDTNPD